MNVTPRQLGRVMSWVFGLMGWTEFIHSRLFQGAIIELRRSSVVKDGLSTVKESELVQPAQNFLLFIALHCEIRLRILTDECSIPARSESTIVFFDTNTQT